MNAQPQMTRQRLDIDVMTVVRNQVSIITPVVIGKNALVATNNF